MRRTRGGGGYTLPVLTQRDIAFIDMDAMDSDDESDLESNSDSLSDYE